MNNDFEEEHNVTIGVEFGSFVIKADGEIAKLQILDTAGQKLFKSMKIYIWFLSYNNNLMFSANEISNLIDK